jgi:YfiH family protein
MQFIVPKWPAPAKVRAILTTRRGGVSAAPFDAFNLASHVGDDPSSVDENRVLLQKYDPRLQFTWLNQVHGIEVYDADGSSTQCIDADAMTSRRPLLVCSVLTADCLPVLLANTQGTQVAAIHAGWRGLLKGVIRETVARFDCPASEIVSFLGVAISQSNFEVGPEVKAAFEQKSYFESVGAFKASLRQGHWLCDLYALARAELDELGVNKCFGGEACSYRDSDLYFSYRRSGNCGRQMSAIWIEP